MILPFPGSHAIPRSHSTVFQADGMVISFFDGVTADKEEKGGLGY